MLVSTGEFLGVGARFRMRGAVGIAFERDRWNSDDRRLGKALFQRIVLWLAIGKAEPPAVIVDHDIDVIGIVERRRAPLERGIVEAPLRRGDLPDQPGKIA